MWQNYDRFIIVQTLGMGRMWLLKHYGLYMDFNFFIMKTEYVQGQKLQLKQC